MDPNKSGPVIHIEDDDEVKLLHQMLPGNQAHAISL